MGDPEPLGEILSRRSVGTPKRKKVALELMKTSWPLLVGERLASRSVPTRLTRGTLGVSAAGGPWASELGMQKTDLIARANEMLGSQVVRKVRIRASGGASPPASEGQAQEGTGPGNAPIRPDEVGGAAGESLMGVQDPELREVLARLVVASRAGRQSKQ